MYIPNNIPLNHSNYHKQTSKLCIGIIKETCGHKVDDCHIVY